MNNSIRVSSIFLNQGARVIRENIALAFAIKCPAWQPLLKLIYLKRYKTGKLHTRHFKIKDGRVLSNVYLNHKWLTPDVIYLLHGTRVTREKIALVSPIKCPAWQPILNTVYLKLEKLIICIRDIAKFETGTLYITYNNIINDSSRV